MDVLEGCRPLLSAAATRANLEEGALEELQKMFDRTATRSSVPRQRDRYYNDP